MSNQDRVWEMCNDGVMFRVCGFKSRLEGYCLKDEQELDIVEVEGKEEQRVFLIQEQIV